MLEKENTINTLCAADIMNPNPKKIEASELAISALQLLQSNNISQLIVTDNQKYAGFVHLHDLIKEGII